MSIINLALVENTTASDDYEVKNEALKHCTADLIDQGPRDNHFV